MEVVTGSIHLVTNKFLQSYGGDLAIGAMTTITSVAIPEHVFPHVEVNINDNTIRRYVNRADEYCRTLCVFRSPKGRDGLQTITGGIEEFVNIYGTGSVSEYGQAFLNASTLAATNAVTIHCLRL